VNRSRSGSRKSLVLVDPATGRQTNSSTAVLERLRDQDGTVERELQALAANSPFRHGRDTGLASSREVTLQAWPRSGAPRAMRDFADFREMSRVLAGAADVPDYTCTARRVCG
jgi:hypothetical protein